MIILIAIIILLPVAAILYTKLPKFGAHPEGARLQAIQAAANYRDKKFQNISDTPGLAEGVSYARVMREFFFTKNKKAKPGGIVPSVKTNLQNWEREGNSIVWFGHSGYLIRVDGKTIAVDPVLSGAASPLAFTTRSFPGSDVYAAEDLPRIDWLFLTHDHWDHLDYDTLLKLKPKVKKIITSLGVGAHLERWGFDPKQVIETNWNDVTDLGEGFVVHTTSARHFSGRGFKRAQSVWSSFALKTPTMNLFLGGDSGYDTHFKEIGKQLGPFDVAILECGQYNPYWRYIHMMPEETVQAARDLQAKVLFPVHWGKFSLALHDWDDPIKRVSAEAQKQQMPLMTPIIGERVDLNAIPATFRPWWTEIA